MEKNDGAFVQLADNVYVDINSGTSTSYYESALRFRHGSVTRFAIEKDNVANADLYIRYYNSSGVLQGSPLKIAGDTGAMTLTTALGLTGGLALTLGAAEVLSIDAGTTDHTSANIFSINADLNSASCNVIDVTLDIGTLLSAGEIAKGCYIDANEVVANADTSGIIGYDTTLTGFATGAADLIGFRCTIDGSKTASDTEKGLQIVGTLTVNHSGEDFRGVDIDLSGLTLTDGTVYGQYIDCGFTNGSTSYGQYINLGTDTTAGVSINGTAATGIDVAATCTTAINVSAVQTDETGYDASCVFQHGTHTTALVYGTQTDHLVLKSTHITAATTGKYILGDFVGIDTSAASTGHIFARKNYITVNHNTGAVRAIYNQVDITATALLNENVTGMKCGIDINAGTITGTGKISGICVEVDVIAGCTVANHIYGIEVDMRDIRVDTAGDKVGIKVTMAGGASPPGQNYLDYGLQFSNCFDTATAVVHFDLTQGSTACGMLFESGAHTTTSIIKVNDIATYFLDLDGCNGANATITSDSGSAATDWKARIKVKTDDGTDGWINVYSTSNES